MFLFIESRPFTKRVERLGLEDSLRGLQEQLRRDPIAGDIEPGTGGLRKLRMPNPRRGKGKRGGARVHYLWLPRSKVFYLLHVYSKDEQEVLTQEQKHALKKVVAAIEREAAQRTEE